MMPDVAVGNVQRQLGEIYAKQELILSTLQSVKADHKDSEERLLRLVLKNEALEGKLEEVKEDIKAIKLPVEQLIQLRSKLGGIVITVAFCISSLWAIVELFGKGLWDKFSK